ncbi:MAG: M15 family metallopeptidase [Oscillospiraceae bacterium]|nr:M15 family metallopeptidase [Oscillospiraceae bacterium]
MSKKEGVIAAIILVGAAAAVAVKFCFFSDSSAVATGSDKTDSSASDKGYEYSMQLANVKSDCIPIYINYSNDQLDSGNLILVNRDHEYKGSNLNMVSLTDTKTDSYTISQEDMKLDSQMAQSINRMLDDFQTVTGYNDVIANSGYRSVDTQRELYNEDIEMTGLTTSDSVAPPGYSEHHTGLAMDFAVNDGYCSALRDEGEYSWVYENADKYGMFLRYTEANKEVTKYKAESWHFRYIGAPHATIVKKLGMPYEDYIDFLKEFSFESPFEYKYSDNEFYSIYYVPAQQDSSTTKIPLSTRAVLSSDKDVYSISGNNVDGFIVTLKIDSLSADYNEDLITMYSSMNMFGSEISSADEQ